MKMSFRFFQRDDPNTSRSVRVIDASLVKRVMCSINSQSWIVRLRDVKEKLDPEPRQCAALAVLNGKGWEADIAA